MPKYTQQHVRGEFVGKKRFSGSEKRSIRKGSRKIWSKYLLHIYVCIYAIMKELKQRRYAMKSDSAAGM